MMDATSMNIRMWARLGQSGVFGQAALALADADARVVALSADMCVFSGLERFRAKYPDRMFNVGIAEQNLVGVAAGLACEGFLPFATTYAAFATMRCADQVKVNMGYMGLPIKLVGLSAGFAFASFGPTHMSLEDVALMRALPNVVVLSPADCTATVKATLAAAQLDAPVYLRLVGNMNCPIVYEKDFAFTVGKAITLRTGTDVALIATGSMVHASLNAAKLLEEQGVQASVVDMHTIQPLDNEAIAAACACKLIVTVEEHAVVGGLGSAVAETLACMRAHPPHLPIGTRGSYPRAGEYATLLERSGLTAQHIAQRVVVAFKELC